MCYTLFSLSFLLLVIITYQYPNLLQVANSNIKVEITNTDKFVNGLQQDLTFEMNVSCSYILFAAELGLKDVLCFTNFPFCKQEINRVAENDFEVVYSSRIVMTGFNKPQSDFIYVNCNNFAGISIYDNFHASVQRHPSVRKFKVRSLLIAVVKLYNVFPSQTTESVSGLSLSFDSSAMLVTKYVHQKKR